jgi:hypothetical protein
MGAAVGAHHRQLPLQFPHTFGAERQAGHPFYVHSNA